MTTTYFLNTIMGNVFGTQVTPALPSNYWLGLSTSEPHVDGTCDGEPSTSGTGYGRVSLNGKLSAPSNGVITNTTDIIFNETVTDLGTITHYVVYDAEKGGNLLFGGAFKKPRTAEEDTVIYIEPGTLTLTLKGTTATAA